jgi:hypothetical protein
MRVNNQALTLKGIRDIPRAALQTKDKLRNKKWDILCPILK